MIPLTNTEVLSHCLIHFWALDISNATVHCARVRYSPITFRIAEQFEGQEVENEEIRRVLDILSAHRGTYPEDTGR